MIKKVIITRIENGDRQYGFGVTEDGEIVYIPAKVVDDFELDQDDVGSSDRMALMVDAQGKSNYTALTFITDDTVLREALTRMKERIRELEAMFDVDE